MLILGISCIAMLDWVLTLHKSCILCWMESDFNRYSKKIELIFLRFGLINARGDQTLNSKSTLTLAILPVEAAFPIRISSFRGAHFNLNSSLSFLYCKRLFLQWTCSLWSAQLPCSRQKPWACKARATSAP